MSQYERSVGAALQETGSKFKLAEALALDIPFQQGKNGVTAELEAVREAIIEAGGEPKAVGTLANYRKTALHFGVGTTKFGWVHDSSFAAHYRAYSTGVAADEFRAAPKTTRELTKDAGWEIGETAPVNVIAGWSDEQKAEARETLMEDAVAKIAAEEPRSLPPARRDKSDTVQVEEEKAHRQLVYAMAEIMHLSRSTIKRAESATVGFNEVMPSIWWEKGFPGETRQRTHEEQVLGDIDRAIEALHAMRNDVARIIDNAKVSR